MDGELTIHFLSGDISFHSKNDVSYLQIVGSGWHFPSKTFKTTAKMAWVLQPGQQPGPQPGLQPGKQPWLTDCNQVDKPQQVLVNLDAENANLYIENPSTQSNE